MAQKIYTLAQGKPYDGSRCPNCKSTEIVGDGVVIENSVATQGLSCRTCNSTWVDNYRLAGYSELETPGMVTQKMSEFYVRTSGTRDYTIEWDIEPYLSDFEGELNYHDVGRKHSIHLLKNDAELLQALRHMMQKENTFIAWKDGKYGILFEIEYCTRESESQGDTPGDYPSERSVLDRLAGNLERLECHFPGVDFALPDPDLMHNNRVGIWAFVPRGTEPRVDLDVLYKALLVEAFGKLPGEE